MSSSKKFVTRTIPTGSCPTTAAGRWRAIDRALKQVGVVASILQDVQDECNPLVSYSVTIRGGIGDMGGWTSADFDARRDAAWCILDDLEADWGVKFWVETAQGW